MSLDVRFAILEDVICPHCGKVVETTYENQINTGGRDWYPLLEELGYYTKESEWYAKDMKLTEKQSDVVYRFTKENSMEICDAERVRLLVAAARFENKSVVINADW